MLFDISDGGFGNWRQASLATTICGNLPGDRQSINRGETVAFLNFVREIRGIASFGIFVTDSAYVLRGLAKLRRGKSLASHVDVWADLGENLKGFSEETSGGKVFVIKIESHQTEEQSAIAGDHPLCFIANAAADAAAGEYATTIAVADDEVAMLNFAEGVIGRIRSRLIATHLDAVEKDPHAKPRRADFRRSKSLEVCAASSEHKVAKRDGRFHCSTCFGSASLSDARSFLKTSCKPPVESTRRIFFKKLVWRKSARESFMHPTSSPSQKLVVSTSDWLAGALRSRCFASLLCLAQASCLEEEGMR